MECAVKTCRVMYETVAFFFTCAKTMAEPVVSEFLLETDKSHWKTLLGEPAQLHN